MVNESDYFLLLFYFRKSKNAVQARKKLWAVNGDVLSERQCQNWFSKLRSGNLDLEDAPSSGWLIKADEDKIKALVDADRHITQEVAEKLKLSNSTVTIIWNALDLFKPWHLSSQQVEGKWLGSKHYYLRFTLKTQRKLSLSWSRGEEPAQ